MRSIYLRPMVMHAHGDAPGSMVYMPYEGSNGIYFVLNGHLVHQMRTVAPINSSMRHMFAFEEIPKSWLNPGDIFGHEELEGDHHIGIKASSNCELYVIKFKELREIAYYFPPIFKAGLLYTSLHLLNSKSNRCCAHASRPSLTGLRESLRRKKWNTKRKPKVAGCSRFFRPHGRQGTSGPWRRVPRTRTIVRMQP